MAEKYIPTLSVKGWIRSPREVADYMIGCFMTAQRSSTVSHYKQNMTLQYMLKEYANRMGDLEGALQTELDRKLKNSFNDQSYAVVNVTESTEKPGQFSINFTGYIYTDTSTVVVGWLVQFSDSIVTKIEKLNNGV